MIAYVPKRRCSSKKESIRTDEGLSSLRYNWLETISIWRSKIWTFYITSIYMRRLTALIWLSVQYHIFWFVYIWFRNPSLKYHRNDFPITLKYGWELTISSGFKNWSWLIESCCIIPRQNSLNRNSHPDSTKTIPTRPILRSDNSSVIVIRIGRNILKILGIKK